MLRELGRDTTEELEYVPGRFVVNQIIRPRTACKGCEAISQTPMPSRSIEKGTPGPGFLAHVLVNKYADHLPLYHQAQIFACEGLDLDRSTLAGGGVNPPPSSNLSPTPSGVMFCQLRPSLQMTRRLRCSPRATALGAATRHQRRGTSSHQTAKEHAPASTSRTIKAGCMPPLGRLLCNRLPGNGWLCWF
jgi:hypothetical protein